MFCYHIVYVKKQQLREVFIFGNFPPIVTQLVKYKYKIKCGLATNTMWIPKFHYHEHPYGAIYVGTDNKASDRISKRFYIPYHLTPSNSGWKRFFFSCDRKKHRENHHDGQAWII